MPQFLYTARLSTGEQSSGSLSAHSRKEALEALTRMALLPVTIKEQAERSVGSKKVKGPALAAMYELLADLLESGVSLLKALDVLSEQTSHPTLHNTISDIRSQVADGRSLADAMRSHPTIFKELPISMVHAGEEGGFLEDSLKRVATFTERQEEMKGRVIGALAYPAFLVVAGIVVVTGMLAFFVPKFEPMFERMRDRGELPLPTILLLSVSNTIRTHGLWILIVIGIIAFAARHWLTSDAMRLRIDQLRLNIKGIGPIVRNLAIARFCRVLGTLLRNGVPILKSLEIAREATGNLALSATIRDAAQKVQSGKSLAAPLAASGQFPREVLEMITVGEQANNLENILLDVADKLERRTHRNLDVLVKLIEPALMVVMAIVIGFLVIALLMPIFESNGLT